MNVFLGYILAVILMLLLLAVLFMTNCKAYIWHISIMIFAFIPIVNWLVFGLYCIIFFIAMYEDCITFKSNKLTKFLFNK